MPDPNQPPVPAGWYADELGGQRWWDGTGWTEHTQPPPPQQPPPPPAPPAPLPLAPQPPASGSNKTLVVLLGAGGGALVLLILAVVLVRGLTGGGPEAVAEDYLQAQFESDYGKVCELTAEDARQALLDLRDADDCGELAESTAKDEEEAAEDYEDQLDLSFDEIRGNFDQEVEITDVDERGDDEVVVSVRQTTDYKGDDAFLDEVLEGESHHSRRFDMLLVEEDGDWKVAEPEYSGN